MKIYVDDRDDPGAAIYVDLVGPEEELNKAKEWCRERWLGAQVYPYRGFNHWFGASRLEHDWKHTTIQFWNKSDVILFKLTWA